MTDETTGLSVGGGNPEEDGLRASATRKATLFLLPPLIVMYLIAFLDRTNLALAKEALHSDIGISEGVYALGAGVFFVGYALCEVPSNLLLYRYGARMWISRIMVTWGLVSAAMMFVVGDTSFVGLRVLLGITEAGFFPGMMLYLTFWFPKKERSRALGLFYFGYPLSMAIGSPVSGALFGLDGVFGLRGWQWMFMLEGGLAVIAGVFTYAFLPDGPAEVRWLTAPEKTALQRVLDAEAEETPRLEGHGLRSLLSPVIIKLLLLYGVLQVMSYGVVFYLPTQIGALLHQKMGATVGLVSAIPWLVALLATPLVTQAGARWGANRLVMAGCIVVFAGGMLLSDVPMTGWAVAGLSAAAAAAVSVQAVFWNLPTAYLTGVQAASGLALINSVGNLGGFLAPNIRAVADGFWRSQSAGLYAIAVVAISGIAVLAMIRRQARRPGPNQDPDQVPGGERAGGLPVAMAERGHG